MELHVPGATRCRCALCDKSESTVRRLLLEEIRADVFNRNIRRVASNWSGVPSDTVYNEVMELLRELEELEDLENE